MSVNVAFEVELDQEKEASLTLETPASGRSDFLGGISDDAFEAFPIPALVINDDNRVVDFNKAGFRLICEGVRELGELLAGDAIGCVHAQEGDGCGMAFACRDCPLKESIDETLLRMTSVRRLVQIDVMHGQVAQRAPFLITTAPLVKKDAVFALVTLLDLREPLLGQMLASHSSE